MQKKILLFFLLIVTGYARTDANPAAAEGKASTLTILNNKQSLRLYRYTEFLTGEAELILRKEAEDSKYTTLQTSLKTGEWLMLANEEARSLIFLAPGDSVVLQLPAPDSLSPPAMIGEPEVLPEFPDSMYAGYNLSIIKFNRIIRDFYARYTTQLLKPKSLQKTLDSLKAAVVLQMPKNLPTGIKEHIRYTLAAIEDPIVQNKTFLFLRYFSASVKWRSPAYFEYFRSFFKDYLYSLSLEEKGKRINHAINISGNLQVLDSAFIQADEFKPNDTLRMLILLNGLGEIYFRKGFEKNKVERIIEQIKLRAPHPAISVMAANMLEKCWLLGRGASLPKLNLERSTGGYTSTDSLREKLTLLAFWTTWNRESMQDMLMLQKLNQKYGNSIRFISVLTDGDREKAQNWKKEKKLNWEFLYDEKNKSVQEKWHILKVPHYLLLDEDGDILRFDAPAPDENLELLLKNELKTRKR